MNSDISVYFRKIFIKAMHMWSNIELRPTTIQIVAEEENRSRHG